MGSSIGDVAKLAYALTVLSLDCAFAGVCKVLAHICQVIRLQSSPRNRMRIIAVFHMPGTDPVGVEVSTLAIAAWFAVPCLSTETQLDADLFITQILQEGSNGSF